MKHFLALVFIAVAAMGSVQASADDLLNQYVAVGQSLAGDNLSQAQKAATALAKSSAAEEAAGFSFFAGQVASSSSLAGAREAFKSLSREAISMAAGKPEFYVFTCPMMKAEWVQKTRKAQNPYAGKSMPNCGNLISLK